MKCFTCGQPAVPGVFGFAAKRWRHYCPIHLTKKHIIRVDNTTYKRMFRSQTGSASVHAVYESEDGSEMLMITFSDGYLLVESTEKVIFRGEFG